jgi:hypothetical protein
MLRLRSPAKVAWLATVADAHFEADAFWPGLPAHTDAPIALPLLGFLSSRRQRGIHVCLLELRCHWLLLFM